LNPDLNFKKVAATSFFWRKMDKKRKYRKLKPVEERLSAIVVISEAAKTLLTRKIERVVPETYRCGVPIKRD
jgi:hypothetical protein